MNECTYKLYCCMEYEGKSRKTKNIQIDKQIHKYNLSCSKWYEKERLTRIPNVDKRAVVTQYQNVLLIMEPKT